MASENVEKIRRGQEGFSRGDLEPMKDYVADQVEWRVTGEFPGLEDVYHGPEAMDEWMETIRSAWEVFEVTTEEVLRDAGDVVVIVERLWGRGRGSGAEVEMRVFSTYWFEGARS